MIVRKLRLQRGWTQEHLAMLTGLSVRSIQRIERGHKCSLETLTSLAAVFEVEISTFQPGETAMNNDMQLQADEKEAMEYVKGLKEFHSHVLMYLVFAVTFAVAFGIDHPFILWGGLGWGAGVIVHGLTAYEVINIFGPGWERRRIEKRLGRKL
ncbi:MAG TPA: 2TM domain-containing protein [Gammaproteobacteria bacterium]